MKREREVCELCKFCVRYYKGKNKKYNCLKMAFCESPKLPKTNYVRGKPRRWIETYRQCLEIITSPRWCPKKRAKKGGG